MAATTNARGSVGDISLEMKMKFALIGDSGMIYLKMFILPIGVGKTSLLNRYVSGMFSNEYYTTIVCLSDS